MGVAYILSRVGSKASLNPADPSQRAVMLAWLNEAAAELYPQADFQGCLVEQVFKVNGDQTISLPGYVGRLRAVREYASMQPWHINRLRPRYNQFNWPDVWRNYRLKNKQALQATVTNQSFGVLTVGAVENPPINVTVSGPVAGATNISEIVTMSATSVQTVNQYLDYVSVRKDRINNYDVTLSDVDGKLLTTIPNNDLLAQYQIYDISQAPWLAQNTSPLDNYVEILYKKTLYYLSNDADEFLALDYDNVLVNKVLQIWKEEQDKVEAAQAYDQKATRTAARLQADQDAPCEDMVALVANPHDTMLKRIGTGLRRRYSMFSGRKY